MSEVKNWSWNGGARRVPTNFKTGIVAQEVPGGEIFENVPSNQVADPERSLKILGLLDNYHGCCVA